MLLVGPVCPNHGPLALQVLSLGRVECSHHHAGKVRPVLPCLRIALSWGFIDGDCYRQGEKGKHFPRGPNPLSTLPSSWEHLQTPPLGASLGPSAWATPDSDYGAPYRGPLLTFSAYSGGFSCVPFLVQVHPLHSELGRGLGLPWSKLRRLKPGEGGAWLRWQLRPEARHPAPGPGCPSPHHTGFISTFISLYSMPRFPSTLLFSFSFSFVGTHLCICAFIAWSRLLPAGGLATRATLTPGVDDGQVTLPALPCVFFPSTPCPRPTIPGTVLPSLG